MANGGTDSADMGEKEDGNISNWSVSRLISSLRYAFRPKDFAKVESVLVAREEKSKLEVETLKQQKDSFFYKSEEERLEKMSLADELEKCKKDCEEMGDALSKLRGENMVLREREKSAEEMCNKLLEELKIKGEKEKGMIDLKSRNFELESAKATAEAEVGILRKRNEELNQRLLLLEIDIPSLRNQEDSKSKSNEIEDENGNSQNGRAKPDETVKVVEVSDGPSCVSPFKANRHSGNAGSGRPPSNIVEIIDTDSEDDCAPVEILSEEGMTHAAENSHSDQLCVENGTLTFKRKRTSSIDVGESENGDKDDTTNGKLKMKKLQEQGCRPDDCPLNHCSTTIISSDRNEVDRGFFTPREDFMVSRKREQQAELERKSQNLMSVFPLDGLGFLEESSRSSDSDSDDDNNGVHIIFNHSQLAPESQSQRGKRN
ncbi:hypothetical protein DITRI_Ditri07aG0124700 [Diplodiscus trichospermus]